MEIRTMQTIEVIAWMKERLADNIQGMSTQDVITAADIIEVVENNLNDFTNCVGDDL